jgi:PAS domain S-box-containing protein
MSTPAALLASLVDDGDTASGRRRLAPRLVLYILLFSGFVTLLATAWQLYFDYTRDLRDIDRRIDQIERSYVSSMALSLWTMDYEQLRIQLRGIQALPDIEYVEVESQGEVLIEIGEPVGSRRLSRSLGLYYGYRGSELELGTLRVVADLDGVYRRLWDKVLVIFASQAIKTFLVAGFIFLIFQLMVTRHLQQIARHVRALRIGRPTSPLVLGRTSHPETDPDELDDVVMGLNRMCEHLVASYRRLAESEERFDLAIRGSNDGLWDWSLDEDRVYFSPRCLEILGLSDGDLAIGADRGVEAWQSRMHPDDVQAFRSCMRRHLRGETAQMECQFRYLLRAGDGDGDAGDDGVQPVWAWVWGRGQALRGDDGRVFRMVGTYRDVTAQKRNEEALAAANTQLHEEQVRLAEARRLACIGELSASIAHEIRNPLSSIVNSLALLESGDLDVDEHRAMVDIVNRETQQLQRILNDFLGFARLRPAEVEAADIGVTLREVADSIRLAIPDDAAITLRLAIPEQRRPALFDAGLVRQVIWNLALNGVQAMHGGGVLELGVEDAGPRVRVSVRDCGRGIPAAMLDKVTRPFVTDREDGTGLGLAMVARILEQHGSALDIDSRPGEGTRMSFELPGAEIA